MAIRPKRFVKSHFASMNAEECRELVGILNELQDTLERYGHRSDINTFAANVRKQGKEKGGIDAKIVDDAGYDYRMSHGDFLSEALTFQKTLKGFSDRIHQKYGSHLPWAKRVEINPAAMAGNLSALYPLLHQFIYDKNLQSLSTSLDQMYGEHQALHEKQILRAQQIQTENPTSTAMDTLRSMQDDPVQFDPLMAITGYALNTKYQIEAIMKEFSSIQVHTKTAPSSSLR